MELVSRVRLLDLSESEHSCAAACFVSVGTTSIDTVRGGRACVTAATRAAPIVVTTLPPGRYMPMSRSPRFVVLESRRLLGHPALWGGVAACALTVMWWWHGQAVRVPRLHRTGAFVAMNIEGSLAVVAIGVAVVAGLMGSGGFDALGRTPYLRVRGVGPGARAVAGTVAPAVAAFVVTVLGQVIAWFCASLFLPAGTTPVPHSLGGGRRTWPSWMQPALPANVPAWLPDLVSIVAFAVVAAGIDSAAGALLRLIGSAWIAGVLTFIAATVSEVGVAVIGLPEQLAPWWALTHRSPWGLAVGYGLGLVVAAADTFYLLELRKDRV